LNFCLAIEFVLFTKIFCSRLALFVIELIGFAIEFISIVVEYVALEFEFTTFAQGFILTEITGFSS